MKYFDMILDLFFPPKCPFCSKVLDKAGICPDCERDLPWIPEESVVREEKNLRCASPLWYEGKVRDGLLRLKFENAPGAAAPMGALLSQCAAEQFGGCFDLVTWVPLSRMRLRKRGYDQARLLAEHACRAWNVKPIALLRKDGNNPPQSGIHDAAARRANVLGMYHVINPDDVAGKRILLVDDICTTGATLSECVRELRLAGAESVVCATVARAERKKK